MYSSPSCWHDALPAVAVDVAAEDETDCVPVSTAPEVPAADDSVGEPEADELGSEISWAPSTPLDETPVV